MAEWIYFLHAKRENFAATMTAEEERAWGIHFERLKRLLAEGTLIIAGPTLGKINTGVAVIEAPTRQLPAKSWRMTRPSPAASP
jgi:uncharacterized protein YciI